jgi:hypothetical protein
MKQGKPEINKRKKMRVRITNREYDDRVIFLNQNDFDDQGTKFVRKSDGMEVSNEELEFLDKPEWQEKVVKTKVNKPIIN